MGGELWNEQGTEFRNWGDTIEQERTSSGLKISIDKGHVGRKIIFYWMDTGSYSCAAPEIHVYVHTDMMSSVMEPPKL